MAVERVAKEPRGIRHRGALRVPVQPDSTAAAPPSTKARSSTPSPRRPTSPTWLAALFPQAPPADQFELEHQIQNACVEELASLGRFTAGPQRALYDALMHRYVAEDLKVLLRLFKQEGAEQEQVSLIHLPPAYALPVELLAESANVGQFLGRIPVAALAASLFIEASRLATWFSSCSNCLLACVVDEFHLGVALFNCP